MHRIRNWNFKRIVIVFILVLAAVITGITLFLYSKYKKIQKYTYEVEENELTNAELDEETLDVLSGFQTIAIFGVDARNNETLGKGTLADVNMICCINFDTGEIRLLSVYRDTYLDITAKGNFNKLNHAYSAGGPDRALQTLNYNLDLNITDFVTVNWKAVADAINILGGIDIEITPQEFKQINGYITETVESTGVPSTHLKSAGMNHLDGIQAVAYCRLRKMDTDYQRTERQRKVIALAMEKAQHADLKTLLQLIDTVFPQTMTSLDDAEIITLAKSISKYHIGQSDGFPFDKTALDMGSKGDCVVPTKLTDNVSRLHEFLYDRENYQPSATVKAIEQRINQDLKKYKNGGSATYAPAAMPEPDPDSSLESPETSLGEPSANETGGDGEIPDISEAPESTEAPGPGNPGPQTSTEASDDTEFPGSLEEHEMQETTDAPNETTSQDNTPAGPGASGPGITETTAPPAGPPEPAASPEPQEGSQSLLP